MLYIYIICIYIFIYEYIVIHCATYLLYAKYKLNQYNDFLATTDNDIATGRLSFEEFLSLRRQVETNRQSQFMPSSRRRYQRSVVPAVIAPETVNVSILQTIKICVNCGVQCYNYRRLMCSRHGIYNVLQHKLSHHF